MTIQFNTDKTIDGSQRQQEYFKTKISQNLERFASHITRIEVHLRDENGDKEGLHDLSCTMEARLQGKQPMVVHSKGNNLEKVVSASIEKMTTSLNKVIGKMQAKH